MARNTAQLTDTQIRKAKPREKEYNLCDPRGLQLRVRPTGSKVWLFNYCRPGSNKRTNLKLGNYPALSLAHARTMRDEILALLAQSIDPQEHRADESRKTTAAYSNTLKLVADRWFEVKSAKISAGYAKDLYNSLDNHIFPKLGRTPLHKITAPATIEVLQPLKAQGKLEMVKRICQRLNMIMDYAVNTGVVPSNPLHGIGSAFIAPEKVHLPTVAPDELPELVKAIRAANIKLVTRYLINWQLHTMVRPSEAAGARWAEIDLVNKLWVIPAERMKKARSHTVPLTPQTIAILSALEPISGHREFLFPSDTNPKKHANSATVNMALRRMGYQGRIVSHGFRALASTTLNEQAFDADIIEAALAHQDKNATRRAYNRAGYLERRATLMYWWSQHIESAEEPVIDGNRNLKLVGN